MSSFLKQQNIILASQSSIRQKLLSSLGIKFEVIPSGCDEEKIKHEHSALEWPELGIKLAEAKAAAVSKINPNAFIIGADQLCVLNNRLMSKPGHHDKACEQLFELSAKTHTQIACLSIAHQGKIVWSHHSTATLKMKELTHQCIEAYLLQEKPYQSCGSYQFEGPGKWLFEQVEGHEDTVLGLPLLPLIKGLCKVQAVTII